MIYEEKKTINKLWFLTFFLFILSASTHYITNVRINTVNKVNREQDSLWKDLYYSIVDTMEKESYLVTVTTYNATDKQTDKTPNLTSAQYKIDKKNPFTQKFIGLSRDLLEEFHYGEIVILENAGNYNGYYIVADCMNSRFLRHVDILIDNKQKHTKINSVVLKHANRRE
jgi:3D (Asp-Asp-Asp) domain-containing protein